MVAVEFGIVTSTHVISKITLTGDFLIKHLVHTIILLLQLKMMIHVHLIHVGGFITISEKSKISLISGSVSETVCDDAAMTPVRFKIGNALSADVLDSSLPSGVVDSFAGGILTISGTPNIDPAQSTVFTYTVTTDK